MSILALTSNTLIGTPAAGNLEYDGQFYGTDSVSARAQMQRITQGTAVASTSGTSIDFTGLPAWVKRITVMFNGVSTNGTSNYVVQIGSGSVTSSGYTSSCANITTTPSLATSTSAFLININAVSADTYIGHIVITLVSGFIYVQSGTIVRYSAGNTQVSAGNVTLSGVLDRVRVSTAGGTDTFDAGSINILYEG
jgi:hypothetical protein